MSAGLPSEALGRLAADARLWDDFLAVCATGGRLAGSQSEQVALQWALACLREISPAACAQSCDYAGWHPLGAGLELDDGGMRCTLAAHALLGAMSTPPGGSSGEVIDLGRGTPEQFDRHGGEIAGRIVLVDHEYPFAAGHIHRRRKYDAAMKHGAAGFVIANPVPGIGPTCGSSGRGGGAGIPALATDRESAGRIRAARAPRLTLRIAGEDRAASTQVLILDLPGASNERVVLSAHLDGHDLAQSAMDNGSGIAVALAVARALAKDVGRCRRGLRVCFFSAEEWALAGSRQYLDTMSAGERDAIALNVNLDTVAGSSRLTALTSEFPLLDAWAIDVARSVGLPLGTYRPLMANSDHFNFARHGIPAMRLVGGFDDAASNIRYILTGADTTDKVAPGELKSAALLTAALVWRGLTAGDAEMRALRQR